MLIFSTGNLERLRRAILAPRTLATKLAWTALAILVPAGIRWFVDRGANGFPFVTFFPAVVLAAVFLDWRFASVAAVGAGYFSASVFRSQGFEHLPLDARVVIAALYLVATAALILTGSLLRHALADLHRWNRELSLIGDEMQHRFKNLLAVVNALALQTVQRSSPDAFHADLRARLDALARSADLLVAPQKPAGLRTIVEQAIAPFQHNQQILISGPDVDLPGQAALALVLVLHELATNAVKHGALSKGEGAVEIAWTAVSPEDHAVHMVWQELRGPPVAAPPEHMGFGSRLLHMQPDVLRIEQHFDPAGLNCAIFISAD